MAKPAWLTITPDTGTGDKQLSVKASVHTGRSNRSGSFTAQTTSGSPVVTDTCAVMQESPGTILKASVASVEVAAAGGTIAELKFITNAQKLVLSGTSGDASGEVLGVVVNGKDYALNTAFDNDPGVNAQFEGSIKVRINASTSIAAKTFGFMLSTPDSKTASFTVKQLGAEATLAVSPASLSFVAKGESKTFAITCNPDFAWSITGTPSKWSISKASGVGPATITVSAPNNQTTSAVSGTLSVTGHSITKTVALSQVAGSVEYILALNSYSQSHPAKGASSTITGTYTVKWNGVVASTENSVVPTIAGTATGFSISGNTVTSANRTTVVGQARTFTGTATYKNGTAAVSITQAANNVTYGTPVLADFMTKNIAAAGGKVTITPTFTQQLTYDSGSTATNSSGGTFAYAVDTPVAGFSLSDNVVTATNNTTTSARSGFKVSVTVTVNGKTSAAKLATFTQSAGAKVYATPTVTAFTYSTVQPNGGTASPTVTYTQAWTWNGVAGSGGNITTGATLSYAYEAGGNSRWSLNTTSGVLTVGSLGTGNVGNADVSGVVTVTVALNGKTATKTATAIQSANSKVLTSLTLAASVPTIAAGGGTSTITATAHYTYLSGSTSTATVTASLTGSATGFTLSNNTVTAANRTTTVGAERSITINASYEEDGITKTSSITVKQAANTVTYGAVTISAFTVADIPAAGGTVKSGTVTYSQVATYTSGSKTTINSGGTVSYSPTAGITASSLGTTVKERTSIGSLTATVSLNGQSASKVATVYQQANTATYGAVSITGGAVSDIPAAGGSVSSMTGISAAQTVTFTSGGSRAGSVSIKYSTAVSANSLGTTVKSRTKIGTLTATATGEGSKTATKSLDVYQAANSKTYGNITIASFSYANVAAAGASSTPSVGAVTQATSFTSGDTSSETISARAYSIPTAVTGASISSTTGVITWTANNSTSSRAVTARLTVTANGKTATKDATCTQNAGVKTYSPVTVTLTYPVIAAKGGTVSPTVSYSQTWGWNGATTGGGTINSGGSIKYSGTSVNTTNGQVTAITKGTTPSGITTVTTATATVTLNGKSGSDQHVVQQEANNKTQVGIEIEKACPDPSWVAVDAWDSLKAGPGDSFLAIQGYRKFSFSSGESSREAIQKSPAIPEIKVNLSSDWMEEYDSVYCQSVKVLSRGTIVGDVRTGTVSWTYEGFTSNVLSFSQKANILTWDAPVISRTTPVSIAATGGTNNVATGLTYSQTGTYSSGSPATASSGGSLSYSVVTPVSGFSLSGSTVTATNNTTLSARNGFVVRISLSLNGKSATKDITYNQAAGYYTYANPVVSATCADVPAKGGSVTSGTATYSQTYGWNGATSGAGTVTTGGEVTWSGGASNIPTLGTKETTQRTVVGNKLVATVKLNGKTGSASIDVYQEINRKTYGAITIASFSYPAVAATGATSTPSVGAVTQATSFTSGDTSSETISARAYSIPTAVSGASINSTSGVITWSANNSTSSRAVTARLTVTANGKTTTKDATCTQNAGTKTYSDIVVSLSYPVIPAGGGTVSPTISYTQTWGWNGSTTGGGTINSGGTISYAGTSVNTSNGSVSAGTKGSTPSNETTVTTATATVKLNGKTGSKAVAVKQQANNIESYNYGTWTIAISANPTTIAYTGGTSTITRSCSRSKTPVYTSGASGTATTETATPTLAISGTGFSLSGTTVTAAANPVGQRTGTVTASYSGATSKSVTITQSAAPDGIGYMQIGGDGVSAYPFLVR